MEFTWVLCLWVRVLCCDDSILRLSSGLLLKSGTPGVVLTMIELFKSQIL